MHWDELITCQMLFGPIFVPQASFYSFRFGLHDGPIYAEAELDAADWTVDFSVGEPMAP